MSIDNLFERPKLGTMTWTFGALPLAEIAPRVSALEYDGVGLSVDLAHTTAETTRQILNDNNLTLFSLSAARVDIAHPKEATRSAAMDHYLQLLDFAAELGQPLVMINAGSPSFQIHESTGDLLASAVANIAAAAQARQLRLAFEVLNRYESALINTAQQGRQLIADVAADNLGLSLNAFHMNIEEQDASRAITEAGDRLWLFQMADSNRQAIGRGHLKLGAHLWALETIGYDGPIMIECMPPQPMPGQVSDSHQLLETHLRASRSWF